MPSTLVVRPKNIVTYARCPNRAILSWDDSVQEDPVRKIIETIVKLSYLYLSRKSAPISWKSILSWSQSVYVQEIAKINTNNYKDMESILSRLSHWYNNYYLRDYCTPGITNIPISIALGYSCYYRDDIPLLLNGKHLSIVDFGMGLARNLIGSDLYNDPQAQVRLWGISQGSDLIIKEYSRFVITPTEIRPIKITIDNNLIMKNNKIIRHIVDGIRERIFYPAPSEQCNNCPYQDRCGW